jgi:hypothetical protein
VPASRGDTDDRAASSDGALATLCALGALGARAPAAPALFIARRAGNRYVVWNCRGESRRTERSIAAAFSRSSSFSTFGFRWIS